MQLSSVTAVLSFSVLINVSVYILVGSVVCVIRIFNHFLAVVV